MPAKVELDTLMREANEAAAMRSHRMGKTVYFGGDFNRAGAKCIDCGAEIYAIRNPAPNMINISGQAVALNCPSAGARA